MTRQILRRCDVCKHFHVSYVVDDSESGKRHLCTTCWKALYGGTSLAGNKEESVKANLPKKKDQA